MIQDRGILSARHILFVIHHHQSELVGDVAVPVSVRQAVLFCALRSPGARPRLNWRRSSSTVLSQVCLGRPGRRLQFLGAGDMQACRAREWYWDLSARATWPNNFRRLIRTVSDSSGWPVRRRTFEIRYTLRPGNVQDTPKTPLVKSINSLLYSFGYGPCFGSI